MKKAILIITTAGDLKWLREATGTLRDPLDVLVIDDATPGEEVADFCKERGFQFIGKPAPRGLTNSWNQAYLFFLQSKYDICILSNNDVNFPSGFSTPLIGGLAQFDIVAPLTNTPGFQPWQGLPYASMREPTPQNIDEIQKKLVEIYRQIPYIQLPFWNGFCFAFGKSIARFKFSDECLFRPTRINVHNEGDLAQRMEEKGGRIAMCGTSYVFHWKNRTLKTCGPSKQQLWR